MSNVANQMTQVNQISEMIEPLIARAEAAEEAERESAEQALAKAYKAAQARMTTLGLTLPPVPEPGLQNYLTAQLAQLNTKQLVKSDLNTAELLERNELFQGLNLYMDGADVAHGTIATLLPSRNPFKHPRGVSFKMEDKEVSTARLFACCLCMCACANPYTDILAAIPIGGDHDATCSQEEARDDPWPLRVGII